MRSGQIETVTAMRIDKWLWYLRFAKSRSIAKAMAEQGHIRMNTMRVTSAHSQVHPGAVLTIGRASGICICRVLAIPANRIGAKLLGQHIQMLDEVPLVKLADSQENQESNQP